MSRVHRPAPTTGDAERATIPRRVWAAVLSNLVFLAAAAPVTWGIAWLARFADRHTASCTVGSVLITCESNGWALVAGTVVAAAATTMISYLVFARSIDVHRGTVGMRQLGLHVRTISDHGAPTRRSARAHWLGSSLPQSASGLAVGLIWFDLSTAGRIVVVAVMALVVAVTVGGALLALADRRTAWDRWSGLEVIIDREPAWTAIAAALVGSLLPLMALATLLLVDFDELQDRYGELTSPGADLAELLVIVVPVAFLTVASIVLGHVGLRATRWRVDHPAGDGAARTGALLGWAAPATVILGIVASLTATTVDSLGSSDCDDARRQIVLGVDSYRTLNGNPPRSLAELADPVYLGEAPTDDRWEYEVTPASPVGYRLTGVGDCAD